MLLQGYEQGVVMVEKDALLEQEVGEQVLITEMCICPTWTMDNVQSIFIFRFEGG